MMNGKQSVDDLASYDYELPEHLIAHVPSGCRDGSRLLVVNRSTESIVHCSIRDLPEYLEPGDCLVLNNTKVIPARLIGYRTATGGKWEGLYLGEDDNGCWKMIMQTRGKLRVGERITLASSREGQPPFEVSVALIDRQEDGVWLAKPDSSESSFSVLEKVGTVPLPPYIKREAASEEDWERYQTTYASRPGAIAAPTAGLHFTPELLERCRHQGISTAEVTLHVGIGTFRPISVDRISEHKMHSEWYEVSAETASQLNRVRQNGGRIVCVGTTTVRTLESSSGDGGVIPAVGETSLFITPGFRFRSADSLLTNFHLPRSTLLILVSAFAGKQLIKKAYVEAVQEGYRFFSYGDAMLIL